MNLTTLLAVIFVVLLTVEWRYRLRSVRLGVLLLAFAALLFAQPGTHRAARRALVLPATQRVTQIPGGDPLSEYAIGVLTMERAVANDAKIDANARLLCLAVLAWLAVSPVLPRRSVRSLPSGDRA